MNSTFERLVERPLNALDREQTYKKGIYYFFILSAAGILVGGIYVMIKIFWGDNGYFQGLDGQRAGLVFRSGIASVINCFIGILAVIAIVLIVIKRARDLNLREYPNLMEYLYKETLPTLIKMYGETLAVFPIALGFMSLVTSIFAAQDIRQIGPFLEPLYNLAGIFFFFSILPVRIQYIEQFSDYINNLVVGGFGVLVAGILISFFIVVLTQVALELYKYIARVLVALLKFIPKFAIPLWVQRSGREPSVRPIDVNDI